MDGWSASNQDRKELLSYRISGSSTAISSRRGTPRRQSAISSSFSVEHPICSPTFKRRSFGSWTDAHGLNADPLDNTTRWNRPAIIHPIYFKNRIILNWMKKAHALLNQDLPWLYIILLKLTIFFEYEEDKFHI